MAGQAQHDGYSTRAGPGTACHRALRQSPCRAEIFRSSHRTAVLPPLLQRCPAAALVQGHVRQWRRGAVQLEEPGERPRCLERGCSWEHQQQRLFIQCPAPVSGQVTAVRILPGFRPEPLLSCALPAVPQKPWRGAQSMRISVASTLPGRSLMNTLWLIGAGCCHRRGSSAPSQQMAGLFPIHSYTWTSKTM